MLRYATFFLALVGFVFRNQPAANAQHLKWGSSAGLVRNFVYPRNFSTKGRYGYVHAEGQLGYQAGGHAEYLAGPETAVAVALRFLSRAELVIWLN